MLVTANKNFQLGKQVKQYKNHNTNHLMQNVIVKWILNNDFNRLNGYI